VLHCVYIVEPPTLLDDLLEDSARIFHRHSGIIQRVFHDQWLQALGQEVARLQIADANANPARVEARARERLRGYRAALRQKRDELTRAEQERWDNRDRAARAYVAAMEPARAA